MKYYIVGLLSGLLWALTGLGYSQLQINPDAIGIMLSFLFILEFSAFLFLGFPFLYKLKENYNSTLFLSILSGIIGGPMAMLAYLIAIKQSDITLIGPISTTYPIFATIFSWLFLKEKISLQSLIGFIIAITCTIIIGVDFEQFPPKIESYIGPLLAIICAISWGTEIILSSYVMKKNDAHLVYIFRQLGSTLGYISLLFLFNSELSRILINFKDLNFLYLSLFIAICSALSYFCYYQAIGKIGVIKAMLLNISYGFWMIVLSPFFIEKPINLTALILSTFILLGASISIMEKK